jgi:hypothetical protein
MADAFTEVTTNSYGSRIKNSFSGVIFGFLLLVGSIILLWWNEGRTIEQADALAEGLEKTRVLASPKYDVVNEEALVFIQSPLKGGKLHDSTFNVSTTGLILKRTVYMYQWKESVSEERKEKLGGDVEVTKTYNYTKVWNERPYDSSYFKKREEHVNPPFLYHKETFNSPASIGDFTLSPEVLSQAKGYQKLMLHNLDITQTLAQIVDGEIYIGKTPSSPQIGDVRIVYSYIPEGLFSIIAQQSGTILKPYLTTNKHTLAFVRAGAHTPELIFAQEQSDNVMMAWLLRALGLFLMFLGFTMILGPLQTLASIVPILGSILGMGSSIIAFILTLILGGSVIALAWFAHRPLLSGVIIVVIVGIVFILLRRKKAMASKSL